MAEIVESGGKKGGKKRAKKSSTHVDMTPMVDLAFLLLTFFVMTSTFSKPKVMSLVYPAKPDDPTELADAPKINNAITFLLSKDKVFYYEGQYYSKENAQGEPPTVLKESNFGPSGLRKLLADKNSFVLKGKEGLDEQLKRKEIQDTTYERLLIKYKSEKEALKVLVKTDDLATCENFIDLIDELKIAQVGVIAPVEILASEYELLKETAK